MALRNLPSSSGESSPVRRVAVLHQGALGDFLLSIPVLEGIHRASPNTRLRFWAKEDAVRLLAGKPFVDPLHAPSDSALTPFYHDDLWHRASVPSFLLDVQATLVFGQSGGRVLAARLQERLRNPVFFIQSFPDGQDLQHVTDFLKTQFLALGWPIVEGPTVLEPPIEERTAVEEWMEHHRHLSGRRLALIHPGSGGVKKIWPLKKWWSLLSFLRNDMGCSVILTLGPADEALTVFADHSRRLGVEVLGELSLPRMAAFLRAGSVYVGSDSGISHLAALVGIPTAVVFGPTRPEVWGPRGSHVRIVRDQWEEGEILQWPADAPVPPLPGELRHWLQCRLGLQPHHGRGATQGRIATT